MSNAAEKKASREEEIAFLVMEQVLAVEIKLADAGGGDKKPDGFWLYPDDNGRRAIVEITSPPATSLMSEWAAAKREGRRQSESGSVPTRMGELAQVCAEMLAEHWATENVDKLLAQPADERHLFLFGRSHNVSHYFYRLSGSYEGEPPEQVDDLVLPKGISDIWFRGGLGETQTSHSVQQVSGWRGSRLRAAGTATWSASMSRTSRRPTQASSMIGFPRTGDSRRIEP